MALKTYNENTSEAPVEKPGNLGRHRPGQTNVEESSEDRLKNLRSQSHHRCQIQMRDMQISTVALVSAAAAAAAAAAAVTASQRQRPIISNMSTMCQQAVWTPIGLFGHLRSDCGTRTARALVSPPISPAPPTTSTNLDRPTELQLPSSSSSSSSSSPTFATVASDMLINTINNHDKLTNTNTTTTAKTDYKVPVYTHPNYDHPFTTLATDNIRYRATPPLLTVESLSPAVFSS
ncbi:hypothetical protein SprV_1002903000 [Sparganum proliferum]